MAKWKGPFTVTEVSKKRVSVTDGRKLKQFNISSILPESPKSNDVNLIYELENIQAFNDQWESPRNSLKHHTQQQLLVTKNKTMRRSN